MEVRNEVRTFKVEYKCPKCDTGYLFQRGIVWDSFPKFYNHECSNPDCKFETMLGKKYPYIEYEINKRIQLITKEGYICQIMEDKKYLFYGHYTGEGNTWNVSNSFLIANEHQDKVKVLDVFLEEEVEIKDVDGKHIAFIKSLV